MCFPRLLLIISIPLSPLYRWQPWVDTQVLASGRWVQAGPQGQRQGQRKEDCAVM
jgi:hypothetical protein